MADLITASGLRSHLHTSGNQALISKWAVELDFSHDSEHYFSDERCHGLEREAPVKHLGGLVMTFRQLMAWKHGMVTTSPVRVRLTVAPPLLSPFRMKTKTYL